MGKKHCQGDMWLFDLGSGIDWRKLRFGFHQELGNTRLSDYG